MARFRKRSDKADALAAVPLFSALSAKQRMEIARHADEVAVQAGTRLTKEGDLGSAFYLIVEGTAEVKKNEQTIASLGAGDAVGEMSLLDGEPRSATVTMTSDGSVLEIHRREFSPLVEEMPGLASQLLVSLSRRLREADRKLVD